MSEYLEDMIDSIDCQEDSRMRIGNSRCKRCNRRKYGMHNCKPGENYMRLLMLVRDISLIKEPNRRVATMVITSAKLLLKELGDEDE